MIFHKIEFGRRRAFGANDRTYTIGYAQGFKRPWLIEEDVDANGAINNTFKTMEEAEAHAHEVEASHLGDEQGKNLSWKAID